MLRPHGLNLLRIALRPTRRGVSLAANDVQEADAKRAEVTMKRFWKTVGIENRGDNYVVTLDSRPLKTPGGNLMAIPSSKKLLATLVAHEWDSLEKLIETHALPLTSLITRTIDGTSNDQILDQVRTALLKYIETDAICFHQEEPQVLVDLQMRHWRPLLEWARDELQLELNTFTSIFGHSQPKTTKERLSTILQALDAWQISALERAVYSTKSLIIGLALIKGRLSIEDAALASEVEVASQIQRWGQVEDTHDVDYHDIRRQLGSVACLLSGE